MMSSQDRRSLTSVTVRKANVQDAEAICRVHKASITTLCCKYYTPEQIKVWAGPRKPENYERLIIAGEAVLLVAELRDVIVGFSMLDHQTGELHALYVHPDNVRCGVGERLLEAAESEARHHGNLMKLTLNATLNSVNFYQSRGYSNLGEATNTLPSGVDLPCVRMEKQL